MDEILLSKGFCVVTLKAVPQVEVLTEKMTQQSDITLHCSNRGSDKSPRLSSMESI